MLEIPQRSSLVAATAVAIRNGIRKGLWKSVLPGERTLCEDLNVSRTTLRNALAMLANEGMIEAGSRQNWRILIEVSSTQQGRTKDLVALVAAEEVQLMAPMVIFYINEMRHHLQKVGLKVEPFIDARLSRKSPEKTLNQFMENHQVACWVLIAPTRPVQEYFVARKVPGLVVGPPAQGVSLPSIGLDYQAICRHAAGYFLAKGHRRIALVIPDSGMVEDAASERGFFEALESSRHSEVEGILLRNDSSPDNICRKLDLHFRRKKPATAFLVCRSLHVITVISHLLKLGLRIPESVSVISRDSQSYLDYFRPELTRYQVNRQMFAERISRLVVQLGVQGNLPPSKTLLLPDLLPGKSVADLSQT